MSFSLYAILIICALIDVHFCITISFLSLRNNLINLLTCCSVSMYIQHVGDETFGFGEVRSDKELHTACI